ncbi:MAG: phosphotransferase, partial [Gammaproteobacteria bacterium]
GAEAAVLGHVHEHDLGPRLDFADVRAGIQLTQYIPGRAWTVADLNDRNGVTRLALMLQRLHGMSPVGAPFALCDRVARYAAGIGSSEAGALEAEIQVLLGRLATHDACLCHNDLVCTNVIEGDRLYLIDWEYAAVGDPFFDLATIVEHHSLADDVTQGLLHDYLGDVTHADRERLADWRQVYRHLLTLWRACVARP